MVSVIILCFWCGSVYVLIGLPGIENTMGISKGYWKKDILDIHYQNCRILLIVYNKVEPTENQSDIL